MVKDCTEVVEQRLAKCQPVNEEVLQKKGSNKTIHIITSICAQSRTAKGTAIVPSDEDEAIRAIKSNGAKEVGECKMEDQRYKVLEVEPSLRQDRYPTGG
jgi:hypothetical protein